MAAAGALAMVLGRPATRQRHFDALDGLRGLAVLVVIASLMSLLGFLPGVQAGGMGKSGVYLFFVLSAFLLTRVLLDRPPAADHRRGRQYGATAERAARTGDRRRRSRTDGCGAGMRCGACCASGRCTWWSSLHPGE